MSPTEPSGDGDTPGVSDKYRPGRDRSLSDTVLRAIADCKGADLKESDFTLYESIDPDALNNLFRHSAAPEVMVDFTVEDVHVRCWGDRDVEVRVTDRMDVPQ